MPTYEGLRLKVLKYWRLGLANYRKKQLKYTDFTIISNNCWGGMIYESYNLPKESPTVGMFFMAKDYIEFLSDLRGYINGKLTFIKPEESRWKDMPQISGDKRFGSYPVGVLSNGKNSIEIFNDQNGCTETEVNKFMKLPYKNKLFFTCKQWKNIQGGYTFIHQFPKHEFIMASYEPFGKSKYIDITTVINQL